MKVSFGQPLAATFALLLALAGGLALERAAHLHSASVVLAVVVALTLTRARAVHGLRARGLRLLVTELASVVALAVGTLLRVVPVLGGALLVVGLSWPVWARGRGPRWRAVAGVAALPFVALFVVPVPVQGRDVLWAPLAAFVGALAASVVPASRLPSAPRTEMVRRSRMRPAAGTRMAVQSLVALSVASLLGAVSFGQHRGWVVLSAYLVLSGNRGRGDVAHKALLRVLGAGVGTLLATLLAQVATVQGRWAVTAAVLVLLVALWLRPFSYAFWAGGVSAVVALLADAFGTSSPHALQLRLAGLALGGVIALATAWFVLPIRTRDVLRARTATALRALSEFLEALQNRDPGLPAAHDRLLHAGSELALLGPALRTERRLSGGELRRVEGVELFSAVVAGTGPLMALAERHPGGLPAAVVAELRTARREVGEARRALAARE